MIWKKGQTFRKMPPMAMIQSISIIDRGTGQIGTCHLVKRSEYADLRRRNVEVLDGQYYFFMEFDVNPPGLHIYPTPDKQLVVRVRYLPKVVEI